MRALYIGSIGLVSSVGHGYHVVFLGFNTSLSQSPFHPRLNPGFLRVTGKLSRKTDIKLGGRGGGRGPRGGGQPVIKKNILLRKGGNAPHRFSPTVPLTTQDPTHEYEGYEKFVVATE